MAFCRKDSRRQDGVDIVFIGGVTDVLGNDSGFRFTDILADLFIDHFIRRSRLYGRHGHGQHQQ